MNSTPSDPDHTAQRPRTSGAQRVAEVLLGAIGAAICAYAGFHAFRGYAFVLVSAVFDGEWPRLMDLTSVWSRDRRGLLPFALGGVIIFAGRRIAGRTIRRSLVDGLIVPIGVLVFVLCANALMMLWVVMS